MLAEVSRLWRVGSRRRKRGTARVVRRMAFVLSLFAVAPIFAMAPTNAALAAKLGGEWFGEGTVTQNEGGTEKVRCRVNYKQESEKVYGVTAVCASTSKKMNQTGELLEVRPGVYSGEFNLTQFDISGRVRVVVEGDEQTVTFKSAKGEGEVVLTRR